MLVNYKHTRAIVMLSSHAVEFSETILFIHEHGMFLSPKAIGFGGNKNLE